MDIPMVVVSCAECSVSFAITTKMRDSRIEDHKTFWCPNGHTNYFPGKTDAEILREKLKKADLALAEKQKYFAETRNALQALQSAERERVSAFVKEQFKQGAKSVLLKDVAKHFKMKYRETMHAVRISGFECKRSANGYQIIKKEK